MVSELKGLKKRYATPRRTRLVEGGDALVAQRAAAVRPSTELQRQHAFEALAGDGRLLIQADGAVQGGDAPDAGTAPSRRRRPSWATCRHRHA